MTFVPEKANQIQGKRPQGISGLRVLDRVVASVSWLTLGGLAALMIARRGLGWEPSFAPWVNTWLIPLLTAGMVGYLTNYLAIWLLFRPYHRHGPFWGVIPRNQSRLAHSLGVTIPARLLPPEALASSITALASEFLRKPELLASARKATAEAVSANGPALVSFLSPYAGRILQSVLSDQLKSEKVAKLLGLCTDKFLSVPENREKLARGILEAFQARAPQLTAYLRQGMREAAISYVNSHFGFMARMLGGAEHFVDGLFQTLDWNDIEGRVASQLGARETQEALANEVGSLAGRLRDYLQTEEARQTIDRMLAEHASQLEQALLSYLQEKLPEMLEALFANDGLWNTVTERLLPWMQQLVERELTAHSEEIVARLDLSGRIESAVESLAPAEAHQLINEVSGRELTLLQVLGFFLGAAAGALMTLAG